MKEKPVFLFWCDLETTGLDPREADILEIAFVLSEFAYPYAPVERGHYLVSGPGRGALLEGRCSEFIRDMHERSGLRAALEKGERTTTLPTIQQDLLGLSERWPTHKDAKVVIAGSTAQFDQGFLRRHLPLFAARLSHRAFDVSAVKLAARSLGMPDSNEETVKEPKHRAEDDILESMEIMRRTVRWFVCQAKNEAVAR